MVTPRERWARLLQPLGLLLLFVLAIRGLPDRARPATPAIECDPVPPGAGHTERLEQCLELRPDDVELMMDLGRAYEDALQWDRAEALYRRALEVDPDDGDAHVRLGDILLRRGDRAGAGREAAAALETQPGSLAAQALMRRAQGSPSGIER